MSEVSSGVHQKFDGSMNTDFPDDIKKKIRFPRKVGEAWIKAFCELQYFGVQRDHDKYNHVSLFLDDVMISQKHCNLQFIVKPIVLYLKTIVWKFDSLTTLTDRDFEGRLKETWVGGELLYHTAGSDVYVVK